MQGHRSAELATKPPTPPDLLRKPWGSIRLTVVGALVGWGATMHAPAVYEMTSRGGLVVGELDGQMSPRIQQLKATLDTAAPTTISTNIYGVLWSKLAINCVITTLGAATGQLLGEMLRRKAVQRPALVITSEVVDVAETHSVSLEPVAGMLDLYQLHLPLVRRVMAREIEAGARPISPNNLKSLLQRREK